MADQNQNAPVPPQAPVPPPVNSGANNDKVMAIIAYIIFFIPLLAVKNRSAYLNYHVNQGLILFIVAIVVSVVLSFLGYRLYFLSQIWNLLVIIWAVLGIINVTKNEMKPLPLIGKLFTLVK